MAESPALPKPPRWRFWRRSKRNDQKDAFPLAELITSLRKQLQESQRRAAAAAQEAKQDPDKQPFMVWSEAEVEVGLTWEKQGESGVEFKVINLGGRLTKANTTTMRITLSPQAVGWVAPVQDKPETELSPKPRTLYSGFVYLPNPPLSYWALPNWGSGEQHDVSPGKSLGDD